MKERDYIKRSITGDAGAQRYLFDQYSARMLKLCKRYLTDEYEAEEAFIQAFRKALEKLHTYEERGENSFKHWLSRIMINECLMLLRKVNRFEKVQENQLHLVSVETQAHESEYIYQFILDLPLGYRTVFNLFAIEGYSHKEIAEMLGIKEATSRSQLNKSRQILQERIKKLKEKNGTY